MDESPETYAGGIFAPPPGDEPEGAFAPRPDQVEKEKGAQKRQDTVENIFHEESQRQAQLTGNPPPDISTRLAKEAPWLTDEERKAHQANFESVMPDLRKTARFQKTFQSVRDERNAKMGTEEGEKDARNVAIVKRLPLMGGLVGLASAKVKYDAAKALEQGTDTETDRRTIAHTILDQREQAAQDESKGPFDKALDTATYLPAFITEWSMLGGLGGVARKGATELTASIAKKAGSEFLATAVEKATAGQALSLAERAALTGIGAPVEGAARTLARPDVLATKTLQGVTPQATQLPDGSLKVESGKPLTQAALDAARSQAIENIVFSAGGPFEQQAGDAFLKRWGKGLASGVISAEMSQELQYWGANAPQGSSLHRIATAKDGYERGNAISDFLGEVAAFGTVEAVMNARGQAQQIAKEQKAKGKAVDPNDIYRQIAESQAPNWSRQDAIREQARAEPKAEAVPAPAPTEAAKTPEVAPAPPPVAAETPEQGKPTEPQRVPPPEPTPPEQPTPQVIPQTATVVPGAGVKELAPGETTTDRGVRKEYQTLENSRLALLNNKTLDKDQAKQFEREVRQAKSSKDPEAVKKVLDTWEADTPEEMAALAKHAELVQPLSKGKKIAPEAPPAPAAPFETTLPPPKPGVPAAFPSAAPAKMTHEELFDRLREGKPIPGLTSTQAKDLYEHHVLGKTLEQIGVERGLKKSSARESVRQSVEKALEAVHDKVEEPPAPSIQDKASADATKKTPEFGELQSNKWNREDRYETALDQLDKQLLEERKNAPHGELTPERLAWYTAEQTALSDEQGGGKKQRPAIRRAIARDKAAEAARTEAKPRPEPTVGHGTEPPAERGSPEQPGTAAAKPSPGTEPGVGQPGPGRRLKRGTRESAWNFEENKLRKPPSEGGQGATTLGQYVEERGGIKGSSLKDEQTLQHYRATLGKKVFSEKGGEAIDTMADGLIRAGIIPEPPPDKHPAQHLLDLLENHHVVSHGAHDAAMTAELERSHRKAALLAEGTQGEAHEPAGATAGPAEQVAPGVMFHHEPIERAGFGSPMTAEERRGSFIAGGQDLPETAERPKKVTALANAQIDKERVARGDPPLMAAARQENAETWDRAMDRLDADPEAGRKLVERLASEAHPTTTVEDNAMLLHRKIALNNEHERVAAEYIRGFHAKLDAATMDALEARETGLARQIDELDKVARKTGTEWGRAGQFRKQLAAEDFSLAGMLQKAAAAKGADLTPEEKVKIGELQQRIKDLEAKLGETEGKVRGGTAGAADLIKARGQSEDAKGEFKKQVNDYRQQREPPSSKLFDLLKKIRINFLISGLNTLAHVSGASAARLVTTPLEQISGAVFSRIPGLAKIAAMAPREGRGFNWKNEAKSFASFFSKGMVDAWRTATTGKSELDSAFGKQGEPGGWANFQFRLHDALKAPAVRAEFTRSFLERMDHHALRGEDVTSPEALLRISADAYVDAQRAKFRQESWLVTTTNNALKINPKASVAEKVAKGTGQLLLPIVRIPTNLVFETATHIFGTVTGSAQAIRAYSRGLETLKPHEADAIMRQFKKGSLGVAMLALGYFKPDIFGGYYQEDEKRKKGELQPGEAQAGPVRIPSGFQHVPLMQVAQFGATIRKVEEKQVKGEKKGLAEGALAGVTGLGTDIPLIREAVDVRKMTDAHTRGAAFGELAKSFIMPQFFSWLAGQMDLQEGEHIPFGHPERRKPTGFGETLETGIPGLRQRVPLRR